MQNRRFNSHDYQQPGDYQLTFAIADRHSHPFGSLTGESEGEARVELSELGEVLQSAIRSIPAHHPEVKLCEFTIMEEHCHIQLQVLRPMQGHLGKIVAAIKQAVTTRYLQLLNQHHHRLHFIKHHDSTVTTRQKARYDAALNEVLREMAAANDNVVGHSTEGEPEQAAGAASPGQAASSGQGGPGQAARAVRRTLADEMRELLVRVGCDDVTAAPSLLAPVFVPPFWEDGYNDVVSRNQQQFQRQAQYIRRNPARLWLKRHGDRRLTRVAPLKVVIPLPWAERLKALAIEGDTHRTKPPTKSIHRRSLPYAATYVDLLAHCLRKRQSTGQSAGQATGQSSGQFAGQASGQTTAQTAEQSAGQSPGQIIPYLRFMACGNISLLECGRPLVRVRLSRSIGREQFCSTLETLMERCDREGAILVSPFISWSEKEVLRAARAHGYPCIILHDGAMSPLWKPSDASRSIERQRVPLDYLRAPALPAEETSRSDMECTIAGELLTLAPWPDMPLSEPIDKLRCEFLNTMAEALEER